MASFPECILCKKSFRWKGPDPYLLPCLHAVCETCQISAEGRIHCSSCQKDADLEKTKLKIDKVRQRLILHLTAKHRPTEILCSHEDDGNQAVCWCQECEEFLCEHCQNMHDSFKATRRHEVQELSEMGTSVAEDESYCSVHKRYILELMDHDCGVLICYKCKHGDHAGHSVEDITVVAETTREELQEHMRAITDVKNETIKLLDENKEDAFRLNEAASAEKERVAHSFDTMTSLLCQRRKQVTIEFETLLDKIRETNSEDKIALKQHQSLCLNILEYIQNILDRASRSELPVIAGIVREAAKECLSCGRSEKKQVETTLSFVNEDLTELQTAISTFSGIAYNGNVSALQTSDNTRKSYSDLQQKCEDLELGMTAQRETIESLKKEHKNCEDLELEVATQRETIQSMKMDKKKCLNLDLEVAKLQETIEHLKRELKTPPGSSASILQDARENLGIKPDAKCHLLKSVEEIIGSFILICIHIRFNPDIANLKNVHINVDGELCNQTENIPSVGKKKKGRFQNYDGTSSIVPLLPAGFLQYWETQATVQLKQLIGKGEILLEIGVCREGERDKDRYVGQEPHSVSMLLLRCDKHSNNMCNMVQKGGEYVLCLPVPDILPHRQIIATTVHYGVVFDYSRRKIAFLDVNEMKVIAMVDNVDTSQPLWPMFGVYSRIRGIIKMRLVTAEGITMTKEKKGLILEAMF